MNDAASIWEISQPAIDPIDGLRDTINIIAVQPQSRCDRPHGGYADGSNMPTSRPTRGRGRRVALNVFFRVHNFPADCVCFIGISTDEIFISFRWTHSRWTLLLTTTIDTRIRSVRPTGRTTDCGGADFATSRRHVRLLRRVRRVRSDSVEVPTTPLLVPMTDVQQSSPMNSSRYCTQRRVRLTADTTVGPDWRGFGDRMCCLLSLPR